jgi:hypothetical protein
LAGVNTSINNFKCREGNRKWKTTRKAVSAAEQKVVESTAMQVEDQEFHAQAHAVLKGYLARATSHADHLEKVLTVREEISERTVSSETTDHVVHSVKDLTDRAGRSEKAQTDHADHSERVLTDRVVRSAKAATVQEEVSVTEEAPDSEEQPRRA